MSRTEKFFRNVKFALAFRVLETVTKFFCRKIFVMVLSQEYLGLNGIFSSLISVLSFAELGVGTAITYSLYKPLAEKDHAQVAALMALFQRLYRIIGLVILILGIALTPLLPLLIRELPDIPNIQLMYMLFVLEAAASYFFSYKQTLLSADQRNYITTICSGGVGALMRIVQAIFLWITKEYFVYLGFKIVSTLLINMVVSHWANRLYPFLVQGNVHSLSDKVKKDIMCNIKALLLHRTGGILVLGTDNLLISFLSGVTMVGLYSNYQMITNGLNIVYGQFYSALIAGVGNLKVTSGSKHSIEVFQRLNLAGNWIQGFSAVCLSVLMNPFIELWLGKDYLLRQEVVCLIALNFYVTGMRRIVTIFRNAYGLYWYDRYKPIAEAIINLGASGILAISFGIAGILAGTLISTILTCFWIEPLVLFRYGFHSSVRPFFCDYVINTLTAILTTAVVWLICVLLPGDGLPRFIAEMAVCAVFGNLGYLIVYHRKVEFRYFLATIQGWCAHLKKERR